MMKKTKMMTMLCMASLLAVGAAFGGCGGKDDGSDAQTEKKIMNISLNPEVEFVLDDENNVLSVNALNEEGNLIISAGVFTGKSAEEAASLFVSISEETGFLVSGNAKVGENEIDISFSGDENEARALYEDVKNEITAYLDEKNITAQIDQAAAITEEKLEALVAECAPYLDEAQVKALDAMELVETLYESRQETVDFYSQELKNAYYEAKAFAMEQAELDVLRGQLSEAQRIAYDMAYVGYSAAVSMIETTRATLLVNESSLYQISLAAFREAKTTYLNYRNEVAAMEQNAVTESILEQLAEYEKLVADVEAHLEQIAEEANQSLDALKVELTTSYDSLVKCMGDVFEQADKYSQEISEKQKEAKTEFFNEFEKSYKEHVEGSKKAWEDMKNDLGKASVENK